ncbi:uncharacterized protein BKCO1_2400067 [Diplodia corticola]|uniref:Transmembrane protein n=1 Tax=Diplodia corticola TaxID=236234 RepID=A0A1J9R244_9PEZI|nr:uncharacterized protein BKCO1_2400067 [Diplodia corticola]OJD34314.1 hypothetical protein BKCO1_2400067 [Diplodia corticola]
MDLRLPRTGDSTYSPQSDATPPSPPLNRDISPENLTANDRVASYKPPPRQAASQNTKRNGHAPLSFANTTDSAEFAKDKMAAHEDNYDFMDSSGVLVPSDDDGAETVSSGSFALVNSNLEETRSVNGDEEDPTSDDEHELPEPVFQPSDSGITTRPDIRTPEASTITEKPLEIVDKDAVHIIQPIIRSYDSQWTGVAGVSMDELKYSVAKDTLDWDWAGPFRVIFAGFPSSMSTDIKSPEDLITDKLVAALKVGRPQPRSSKTCTPGIRMSYDNGSDVLLKEIFNQDDQGSDMLADSIPTTLPNLVIMCNQPMDLIRLEDENLVKLRAIMADRGVPILSVSLSSPVSGYYSFSPDSKSLKICLKSGEEEIGVVPIDLNNFLSLDNTQLNRHLACIGVGSNGETSDRKDKTEEKKKGGMKSWLKGSAAHVRNTVRTQPRWALLIVGLLVSSIAAMLLGGVTFPGAAQNNAVQKAEQAAALNSALQAFTGAKTDVSVLQRELDPNATAVSAATSGSDKVVSNDATTKSVSVVEHPFSPRANDSGDFKLRIVGDRHFVLTPPKSLASLWKAPKIVIRVQRGSEGVPFTTEQLVEGVHAVSVEPKDAYGILNVTVCTESRPKIKPQNFTVDFGSPWLKMSHWTDLMKTDFVIAQSNAKNASLALFKHLQGFGGTSKNITDAILHSADSGAQTALQLFNQTLAVSNKLREKQRGVTNNIVDAAKQLDLVTPVNQARRNANRIARRLGLKKPHDKEQQRHKGESRPLKERPCGKKTKP